MRKTSVIAYSIPLEDYRAVFPEYSAAVIPGLYGSLLKFIMTELQAQIRDAGNRHAIKPLKIDLVHDRTSSAPHLSQAFRQMQEDQGFAYRERFRSISERSWEDCIPLQAADFLAYESFKDTIVNADGLARRKPLEVLLSSKGFGGRSRVFDRASLEKLKTEIGRNKAALSSL